jgi:GDP-4-dehydro-6-deoxy-D-mannose reductase
MKTVLVLGVSGFTGRSFQDFVMSHQLSQDFRFIGVGFPREEHGCVLPYVAADLSQVGTVEEIILQHQPEYILNFAGRIHSTDFQENLDVNTLLSRRLLDVCQSASWPLERILLIGSAAEYGQPMNLPIVETHPLRPMTAYGLTKQFQTELAQFYWRTRKVPVCVARPFNLVGARMPPSLSIGSFLQQIRTAPNHGVIRTGDLSTRRDFLDIRDAVRAYWDILLRGVNGEVYNVCSGHSLLLSDMVVALIQASGKQLDLVMDQERLRKNDVPDIFGSCEKLHGTTGWKPRHFLELKNSPVWTSLLQQDPS